MNRNIALLALAGIGACSESTSTTTPVPVLPPPATFTGSVVKITGAQGNWQLSVNGSPYIVKGAAWGPNISAANVGEYMADVQSLGVNTIRTWGTDATSRTLLDAAVAKDVKVVMGFWLQQDVAYATDQGYKDRTLRDIKQRVADYKDHPGVLMWDVGNEVLLALQDHFSGTALEANRVAYAQFVNEIAAEIHTLDPNHPVTSTEAWTGGWAYYKASSPSLDLLAINAYGGVCAIKNDWITGGYAKPYIVTEWGNRGEWEVANDSNGVPLEPSDVEKRDAYPAAWACITGHSGVALGGTLFIYGDKEDFGGIWFNLKNLSAKRMSYYAVKQMYTGRALTDNTPPQIQSMTLSQTANIRAGTPFDVSVSVLDPDGDSVTYALKLSGKYVNRSNAVYDATYSRTAPSAFTVTAPLTPGVWKLYVYANDGKGNVGIDSRSFRVVP